MSSRDVLFCERRLLELVGKFVEARRDSDGAWVTRESLVAAWSAYRAAQAAEER